MGPEEWVGARLGMSLGFCSRFGVAPRGRKTLRALRACGKGVGNTGSNLPFIFHVYSILFLFLFLHTKFFYLVISISLCSLSSLPNLERLSLPQH